MMTISKMTNLIICVSKLHIPLIGSIHWNLVCLSCDISSSACIFLLSDALLSFYSPPLTSRFLSSSDLSSLSHFFQPPFLSSSIPSPDSPSSPFTPFLWKWSLIFFHLLLPPITSHPASLQFQSTLSLPRAHFVFYFFSDRNWSQWSSWPGW